MGKPKLKQLDTASAPVAQFLRPDGSGGALAADHSIDIDPLGNLGATGALNWSTSQFKKGTLTANWTPTLTDPGGGMKGLTLILVQDATGSRTVTWPSNFMWAGGTAVQPATAANSKTIYTMIYDDDAGEYYCFEGGGAFS